MVLFRALPLLVATAACGPWACAADLAGLMQPASGEHAAARAARPVAIRVQWGGGAARAWTGSITPIAAGTGSRPAPAWRTLSPEPDAAAMAHDAAGAIHVHQSRPVASDGVELTVSDWRTARIAVRLVAVDSARDPVVFEASVADILAAPVQRPLDDVGNRIVLKAAMGDALRVTAAAAGTDAFTAAALGEVRAPGDHLLLRVEPLLPTTLQGGHSAELRMRLRNARQGTDIAEQSAPLVPIATTGPLTDFEPVVFEVVLPAMPGVFDVELEAVEGGSLRWSRSLAERSVQVAAMAAGPAEPPSADPWKTVYELDPGSPRLHERLRRLPGMPLPTVPLPSLPRPPVTLPRLPSVALPDVSAMVPRFSGLLAHGDSTVEPHPLGPMLRLPPARAPGTPSWEAIALPGVQPGMPLAVEVEYPADQDAVLAVVVLETDAAGATVEPRHAGGVDVRRPLVAGAPRLGTHRFVFWPTTKNPLVVIANASTSGPAMFGRVRVAAGPVRLPVAVERRAGAGFGSPPIGRRTYAMLHGADLVRDFGGGGRTLSGRGRAANDWGTHLDAVRHAAEALRSQAAAGGMVTVLADGAAAWPSAFTREAAAWDFGARAEGDQPASRDLLTVLARGFENHGLALVPAFTFDAPLAALEAEAGLPAGRPGITCIGGDGRPRLTARGMLHYNVLDPRVQQAVENLVVEAARRLKGSRAVEGFALQVPHDGWLHLPGVASGLDDATFARFVASLPEPHDPQEGEGRFAARARLVEGPLRAAWVEWRCREVAAFHARLAAAVAGIDDRWSLHIVPTSLFAVATQLAEDAAAPGRADDMVREAGFDPAAVPREAAGRVVFVAPHVCAPALDLRDRAACAQANGSAALVAAAAAAPRRAAAIVAMPLSLDLAAVATHGPFGTATLAGPVTVAPVVSDGRPLADALAACDAEAIFDGLLLASGSPATDARWAFESLPPVSCTPTVAVPRPVVVRGCGDGGLTRVMLVNPTGAPVRAVLMLGARPSAVVDTVGGVSLPIEGDLAVPVTLDPFGVRTLVLDGGAAVERGRLEYPDEAVRVVTARVEGLKRRRAVLEAPVPLEVLDNPGFELGAIDTPGRPAASIAGWEVLESRRGALTLVAGAGEAGAAGRGLAFSSLNGLATLRSNPFAPPRTGRISVAAWLRVSDGPQPPLRIAVEGVQGDREYYRFAAVGGLTGGRPLTGDWSQFVLQVDDLPAGGVESLRVRFDLLGPGRVEIDEVRVFDLAFDESQRARITKAVSLMEHQAATGDVGGCLAAFDGYWPAFLEAYVPDAVVEAAERRLREAQAASDAPPPKGPERQASGGIFDRMRSWWQ